MGFLYNLIIIHMYFIIIAIIIFLDQLVKYLIQANMELNNTLPIVRDFFHLTYIHNTGAAFSILEGKTEILIILPSLLTLLLIAYVLKKRKSEHWVMLLSLSLIIAGGIGNLIDRISYGYVVDYLDFRVFPIFNVADIAVSCGCALLLIYMFFIEAKLSKEKKKNE